jgi:hypothetical protein
VVGSIDPPSKIFKAPENIQHSTPANLTLSWPRATSQEVPRGQLIETVCLSGSKKAVICIIKCCKQIAPK